MGTEGNRQVTLPFIGASRPFTYSFPAVVFRGARISSLPTNAFLNKNNISRALLWGGGGGGTLGMFGWGCATGTLQPLAYTRASSAEFCYPLLG